MAASSQYDWSTCLSTPDLASLMGLVQQVHLSSVAEQASLSSLFGSEEEFANDGISISSTNNQMLRSATGSTTGSTTGSASIEGIARSPPAPAPSGDEVLNLGDDNGNIECVLHSLLYNSYSIALQYARLDCPHKATSATGRPCHHTPSRDTCNS